jgi:hypothetical protein
MDTSANHRALPTSELDLNLMLTNSVWGQGEISEELIEKLQKHYMVKDPITGKMTVEKQKLWGLLGFYTRDMRLGNLSEWNNELQTCRYMIDLANDYLSCDMIEPFLLSLSRAATILETSQSKGGFLRTKANTLRQENINQTLEPPKKALWGGKTREGGN